MIIEEVILDDFDIKRHLEYILREQNKHLTLKKIRKKNFEIDVDEIDDPILQRINELSIS